MSVPSIWAACSNEDNIPSILPSNQPDAVELGITAGVTLTKSVINSGTQANASKDDVMKSVAVYARLKGTVVSGEDPYTNAKSNNYALYTYSTTGTAGWKSGDKKIYLTSEVAKIYAYYPAYQPGTNQELATTTALVLSDNTATDNSTIPVTVFLGETDDAHRDYPSTLIDNSETTNTNKAKINSAKGEIDYMWADQGSSETNWITASNTKKETSIDASVDLTMKHALTLEQRKQIMVEAAEQRYVEFLGGETRYTGGTPHEITENSDPIAREFYEFYRTSRGEYTPEGATPLTTTHPTLSSNVKFMNFYPFADIETISPRPMLFVTGENAHSREFSEDAYRLAAEPKELYIVPGAGHVDLYDRVNFIPFDKLEDFFKTYLK